MKLDPLEVDLVAKQYPEAHCVSASEGYYIMSVYKKADGVTTSIEILGFGRSAIKAWTNAYKNMTAPPKKKRGSTAKP